MATRINTPLSGEIWHLSIDDLLSTPMPEKPRLGGPGPFVINLSASTAPISKPPKAIAACPNAYVYQIQRMEDRRLRFRLRLGPFETEDEADAVLDEVRDLYPSALTATADGDDARAIEAMQGRAEAQRKPVKPEAAAASLAAPPEEAAPHTAPVVVDRVVPAPVPWSSAAVAEIPTLIPMPLPARKKAAAPIPILTPAPIPARAAPAAPPASTAPLAPSARAAPAAHAAPIAPNVSARAAHAAWSPPKISAPSTDARTAARPAVASSVSGASGVSPPAAPAVRVTKAAPAALKVPAPAPRKESAPAAPKVSAPVASKVSVPAAPKVSAPIAPKVSVPATPKVSAPVASKVSVPAAPKVSAPVAPTVSVPIAPMESAPAASTTPAPAAPTGAAPAAPPASAASDAAARAAHACAATPTNGAAPAQVPGFLLRPVEQLNTPLPSLESTQTLRPITPLELENEDEARWFVIQLSLSEEPFNPDTLPNLDIFNEYRLYSVLGPDQDRLMYALRLGFFAESVAAGAVAGYLAAFYQNPTVKRISAAERARFAERRVEARKDIGATGRHAVIEITSERVVRDNRGASASVLPFTVGPQPAQNAARKI